MSASLGLDVHLGPTMLAVDGIRVMQQQAARLAFLAHLGRLEKRNTPCSRPMRFDMICEGQTRFVTGSRTVAGGIEHRPTKPNHPWSSEDQKTIRGIVFPRDGQVERMNRTIKEATVKCYHYDSHDQLRAHLADFIAAYNFARRLKTLSGLTPYEYICKVWTSSPDRFIVNPIHQMPGLNT